MLDASRNDHTEYFLCHLCLSVFKKSIREMDTDSVTYPSLFVSETLQFIQVLFAVVFARLTRPKLTP